MGWQILDIEICRGAYFDHRGGAPKGLNHNASLAFLTNEWGASRMRAVGAAAQDGLPAEERKGVLWDAMRALTAQGWEPDTFSYTTAFRHAAAGCCVCSRVLHAL